MEKEPVKQKQYIEALMNNCENLGNENASLKSQLALELAVKCITQVRGHIGDTELKDANGFRFYQIDLLTKEALAKIEEAK